MGRLLFALPTLALLLYGGVAAAQVPLATDMTGKEGLDIGTSTSEIAITSDFRGADLTIFGSVTNSDTLLLAIGQYDVVVTLEGPRDDTTVRRKDRVFGIWVNRTAMTFEHMPTSYSLASTRALSEITKPQTLTDLGIGIDYMSLTPTGYLSSSANLKDFREAFRRIKQTGGLYQGEDAGVRFVSSSLFKATLRLPASIPDGVHIVHAYLFKTGEFIAERELHLRVIKTGLEDSISRAAHESPLTYGLLSVLLALITGWVASLMFRRD